MFGLGNKSMERETMAKRGQGTDGFTKRTLTLSLNLKSLISQSLGLRTGEEVRHAGPAFSSFLGKLLPGNVSELA